MAKSTEENLTFAVGLFFFTVGGRHYDILPPNYSKLNELESRLGRLGFCVHWRLLETSNSYLCHGVVHSRNNEKLSLHPITSFKPWGPVQLIHPLC